jgi:hypothetical protein
MTSYLIDINVWLALTWDQHPQHVPALHWYDTIDDSALLFCRFTMQIVDHAVEYVKGNIHTNGMENFWSHLKRTIYGTYIFVMPFHLFRYLDEQSFRFNNRDMTDALRFRLSLRTVTGRRLTYKEVTGKTIHTCRPQA